jgi:hypothetical protein
MLDMEQIDLTQKTKLRRTTLNLSLFLTLKNLLKGTPTASKPVAKSRHYICVGTVARKI